MMTQQLPLVPGKKFRRDDGRYNKRGGSSMSMISEDETQFSESSSVQTQQTGTSARLFVNEGIVFHKKGDYDNALRSFFSALKSQMINRNAADGDHPFLANTLANIGSTYLRQGRHIQAADSLEEASGMMKRLRKKCDTQEEMSKIPLAGVLNNLGTVEYLRGNHRASLEYYRGALKDARSYGGSKKEVANALHNIGRLNVLQKQWDSALSMLTESLQVEKELCGDQGMALVDTLNLIGFVHFSAGSHDAAMVMFAEALSTVHSNCGLVHEKVASSLLNVGMVMERQGRLKEALQTFSTARDVFEQVVVDEENNRGWNVAKQSVDKIQRLLHIQGSISSSLSHQQTSNNTIHTNKHNGTPQQRTSLWMNNDDNDTTSSRKQVEGSSSTRGNNIILQHPAFEDEDVEYREDPNWEQDYSSIVDSRDQDSLES